ncbi:F-box domain [Macleaya cordata]|uniref:F-box domain n=1 Tax=Macleaya cordata TaxID=56857 RepID=A0A200QVW4_MACCD|nr:F-box domain [Macleaya cordata]
MENFFLPEEITRDTLSRLPFESVLECKLVCKTWRNLIYNPYFFHLHLRRLYDHNSVAGKVGLLFITKKKKESKKLYYGEYVENDDDSCKKLPRINLQLPVDMACIVGSCNGLICISITHGVTIDDPVYICNPITRECVNLPRFKVNTIAEGRMLSGFGYYHSSTNEYKVVRIFYSFKQPSIGRIQVYTLGGGSGWRDVGEITYPLEPTSRPSPGTLANGALHWVDYFGNIFAFDLADEVFRLLPPPPCFRPGDYNYFQLKVLGGWLCVFYHNGDGSLDVWSLKKQKNISKYDIKEQDYYKFWSWSKELIVKKASMYREDYCPLESGKILIHSRSTLSRYDPNMDTTQPLVKFDKGLLIVKVIPDHMNSFVSLKALGEEDTKTIVSAS